jgi:hypothetical protein
VLSTEPSRFVSAELGPDCVDNPGLPRDATAGPLDEGAPRRGAQVSGELNDVLGRRRVGVDRGRRDAEGQCCERRDCERCKAAAEALDVARSVGP